MILKRFSIFSTDGDTKGPDVYNGRIGKRISGKHGLARQNMNMSFVPISDGEIILVEEEFLQNNDLKLLYKARLLVILGVKNADAQLLNVFWFNPGHIHGARWVTLATNLLFLYMQEVSPSQNLILLVKYVVHVYCPAMFYIKKTWQCWNGTHHIFHLAQLAKNLLQKDHPGYWKAVMKTLQDNGYYCHPEQILLSMVHDEDTKVREKAVQIIAKLRAQDEERARSAQNKNT